MRPSSNSNCSYSKVAWRKTRHFTFHIDVSTVSFMSRSHSHDPALRDVGTLWIFLMRRREDFQLYLRGQNCFFTEKSSYFGVTFVAINQIILKRRWHIFQAAFMLTNPDNFYETLGHFPVVSVAQKASRFDKMPVKFPAVFVATKLNIHDEASRHFLLCLWQRKHQDRNTMSSQPCGFCA